MAALSQSQFKAGMCNKVLQARNKRVAMRMPTRAYGENNSYVDLDDLENTVGSWARYEDDNPKRYPDLQVEFFERAAAPLVDRRVAVTFCAGIFCALAIGFFFKGTYDLNLAAYVDPASNSRWEKYLGVPNLCPPENTGFLSPLCIPGADIKK